MGTITEDYVSFETAKLLKERGFKGKGEHFYENNKIVSYINYWNRITPKQRYEAIEAPTLQMAMKWLREVYSLHIWIGHAAGKILSWYFEIHGMSDGKVKHIGGMQCGSYEVACETAIKYCLEHLI